MVDGLKVRVQTELKANVEVLIHQGHSVFSFVSVLGSPSSWTCQRMEDEPSHPTEKLISAAYVCSLIV